MVDLYTAGPEPAAVHRSTTIGRLGGVQANSDGVAQRPRDERVGPDNELPVRVEGAPGRHEAVEAGGDGAAAADPDPVEDAGDGVRCRGAAHDAGVVDRMQALGAAAFRLGAGACKLLGRVPRRAQLHIERDGCGGRFSIVSSRSFDIGLKEQFDLVWSDLKFTFVYCK